MIELLRAVFQRFSRSPVDDMYKKVEAKLYPKSVSILFLYL